MYSLRSIKHFPKAAWLLLKFFRGLLLPFNSQTLPPCPPSIQLFSCHNENLFASYPTETPPSSVYKTKKPNPLLLSSPKTPNAKYIKTFSEFSLNHSHFALLPAIISQTSKTGHLYPLTLQKGQHYLCFSNRFYRFSRYYSLINSEKILITCIMMYFWNVSRKSFSD